MFALVYTFMDVLCYDNSALYVHLFFFIIMRRGVLFLSVFCFWELSEDMPLIALKNNSMLIQ